MRQLWKYFRLLTIGIIGMLSLGCEKAKLHRQLTGFIDTEITLPSMVKCAPRKLPKFEAPMLDSTRHTLIVYFDSTQCSSCLLGRLYEWGEVAEFSRDNCNFVMVFSPKQARLSELKASLQTAFIETDVWVDENGDFARLNQTIPSDVKFHTFLLNPQRRVILVGDPVHNHQIWDLYKTTIRN